MCLIRLIGIQSISAFMAAVTKFSYTLFRVCVSVISWGVSNLFFFFFLLLCINGWVKTRCNVWFWICFLLLRRLRSILTTTNLWRKILFQRWWWCPRGGLWNRNTRVRTSVALLRSLSDKYPGERYEFLYPPSYELKNTTAVLLEGWLWY